MRFISEHKGVFGVEPICRVLSEHGCPIAPSTYYDTARRPRPARAVRDEQLKAAIGRVHAGNFGVYGARKVWLALNREGTVVARCTVERLMRELGISGARSRRKRPRATVPGDPADRPSDLLERCFDAPAPNRRRVADITYVLTLAGWVYTAFVMDLFARRILGWQVADNLRSDLAIDALEMAIWARRHESVDGLVHHSDRGVQYTAIRYTKRLEEAKAVRSVGSKGDSYDNAAAESLNSLYKRELIDFRGGRQGVDDVMVGTADWVHWYNEIRIHSYSGDMPPKMYEEIYSEALKSGKLRGSSQT